MDNDNEEDLKMMCLFRKKEIRKVETPANIISEVRSILISIFPCLTISEIVPYRAPCQFCCMISTVSQTGGGDFERAKPRLVQLHRERSFSRLGARLVGIGWPTLCFIVVY
jgi:hypothetical protein